MYVNLTVSTWNTCTWPIAYAMRNGSSASLGTTSSESTIHTSYINTSMANEPCWACFVMGAQNIVIFNARLWTNQGTWSLQYQADNETCWACVFWRHGHLIPGKVLCHIRIFLQYQTKAFHGTCRSQTTQCFWVTMEQCGWGPDTNMFFYIFVNSGYYFTR